MEPALEACTRQRELAASALDYARKALSAFLSPDYDRISGVEGAAIAALHVMAEMQLERTKALQFLDRTGIIFGDEEVRPNPLLERDGSIRRRPTR
jgi:hypothetical protein